MWLIGGIIHYHPCQQCGRSGVCQPIYPRRRRGRTTMTTGSGESGEIKGKQPYGRALWPEQAKADLFAVVKAATEIVRSSGLIDRGKDEGKSAQTLSVYRRLARGRADVTAEGVGTLMDGVTADSWHTTKAAVLHHLAAQCREARKVADRTLDLDRAAEAAAIYHRSAKAFADVKAMDRPIRTTPVRSKRKSLPAIGWQRLAFDSATDVQKGAVAVMWATGCRPAEIAQGVTLKKTPHGILVMIPGVKVREMSGQPSRHLLIDMDSDAGRALVQVMGDADVQDIERGAKRIAEDLADIRRRSGLTVSAYSFRHQVASDLKAQHADPVKVAEAMGHASTRMQARYGDGRKGSTGGAILDAKAEREVRVGRTPIPGRSPEPD